MVNYTDIAANCLLNTYAYTYGQKQLPALVGKAYPYDEQCEHRDSAQNAENKPEMWAQL